MALSTIYFEYGNPTRYGVVTLRKYDYVNVVQGHYGNYGWEDVCTSDKRSEAIENLREYRENCPEYAHRIIRRREVNPIYKFCIENNGHRNTIDGRIVLPSVPDLAKARAQGMGKMISEIYLSEVSDWTE